VKSPLQRLREEGFIAQKTRDGAAVLDCCRPILDSHFGKTKRESRSTLLRLVPQGHAGCKSANDGGGSRTESGGSLEFDFGGVAD
jgi:hypothetical protein